MTYLRTSMWLECESDVTLLFSPYVGWKELDHKEDWMLKNRCFWIVMLEETLECPLDWTEIKPVSLKGNEPWIFIGRIDAEAEAPILWPPDAKNWLTGKDPDDGREWRQKEKGAADDEMIAEDSITNSTDMNLSELWVTVKDRGAWCAAVHGVSKNSTLLSKCTAMMTMALLLLVMTVADCHGTGWRVIQQMLIYYNECIVRLRVYWKLNLLPFWA